MSSTQRECPKLWVSLHFLSCFFLFLRRLDYFRLFSLFFFAISGQLGACRVSVFLAVVSCLSAEIMLFLFPVSPVFSPQNLNCYSLLDADLSMTWRCWLAATIVLGSQNSWPVFAAWWQHGVSKSGTLIVTGGMSPWSQRPRRPTQPSQCSWPMVAACCP